MTATGTKDLVTIRLPRTYDPDLLLRDLQVLRDVSSAPQPGPYHKGEWTGIGHTPLGALSVVAMFVAVAVQVSLGLISQDEDGIYFGPLSGLVSSDTSDKARDIHELWFNVIVALIVLHVGAILYYRLFRGRKLTKPMITGRAELDPVAAPMRPAKWWIAVICIVIAFGIARWVVAGAPPFGSPPLLD